MTGVQINGKDFVRKRRMDEHRVADDQRRTFVAAQHAGGERPGNLHFANVAGIDLIELAVTLVVHVASLHRPVLGVGNVLLHVGVGHRQAGRSSNNCRHQVL